MSEAPLLSSDARLRFQFNAGQPLPAGCQQIFDLPDWLGFYRLKVPERDLALIVRDGDWVTQTEAGWFVKRPEAPQPDAVRLNELLVRLRRVATADGMTDLECSLAMMAGTQAYIVEYARRVKTRGLATPPQFRDDMAKVATILYGVLAAVAPKKEP